MTQSITHFLFHCRLCGDSSSLYILRIASNDRVLPFLPARTAAGLVVMR
jgi:hypothetical protein